MPTRGLGTGERTWARGRSSHTGGSVRSATGTPGDRVPCEEYRHNHGPKFATSPGDPTLVCMGTEFSTDTAYPARAQVKRVDDGALLTRRLGLTIRAWRVAAHPDTASLVAQGRHEALRYRGVEASLLGREWPSVTTGAWMVLAEESPALRGGIFVELGEDDELPLEGALRALGVSAEGVFSRSGRRRSCELTKLWVASSARGRGLGHALIKASVVLARRLGLAELHVLAPDHTIHHFCSLGAEVHREFGDQGSFPYPTADYRSWLASLLL